MVVGMGIWGLGSLCAYLPEHRRLVLADSIVDCEGNLSHMAYDLGYHRSHIYRLIYQYKLWAVVNRLRKRRLDRNARERRRN